MMKKKISLIAVSALLAVSLTGCGIVTVVPIGQESSFTGEEKFDSGAQSSSDWSQIADELTEKAAELSELMAGDGIGSDAAAVKGKASIVEFNTETPKHYLLITLEGYEGSEEFRIQAGGVYSGTAIRDVQTLKEFADFTNQTEWSQYAKALNKEADAQTVAPLALDESAAGKTVTFVGAATATGDTVTITPVALTIE
ncbi:MAG: DUF2291 family protein [Candidatus Limivivens sp.]|nr:DUF2291 family protein [Candidatus Limivivens sp.]